MIKSICIVRLSALGDVLMLVPLIRTLQTQLPDTRLTWIITRPAFDLVEGMEGVEFIVIDKPATVLDYWRFYKQFRTRQFDVLLAAQSSLRANLLYPLIHAKRKIGYDRHRAKDGHGLFITERISPGQDHTLDGFLKFAAALGIHKPCIRWDLPIEETYQQWARLQRPKANGPILLINPAASKPERSWPVARYTAVIQQAQQRWNAQVILVGGPGAFDKALGDELMASVDAINLIGMTKPKQLLALIREADVLLCPDTGPSHMAAAVGTPVVALHAVTSSLVSGPYTCRHLAVDCYGEAIKMVLGKPPETVPWGMHIHGLDTMKVVSVTAVMEKLAHVMHGVCHTE